MERRVTGLNKWPSVVTFTDGLGLTLIPVFSIIRQIALAKQASCASCCRCCDSKLLMALRWEEGGEKESTTPSTTNLVGRVNSVTTTSDRHRSPFTDGTSNYPGLLLEVSRKDMERKPQGGQLAWHQRWLGHESPHNGLFKRPSKK